MSEETRVLVATISRKCCELIGKSFEEFPRVAHDEQYTLSSCPQCGDDTWLGVKTGAIIARGEAEQLCIICTRNEAGVSTPITPIARLETIVCPQCESVSYNPNDIAQRYCGRCHQFHDLMKNV